MNSWCRGAQQAENGNTALIYIMLSHYISTLKEFDSIKKYFAQVLQDTS